MPLPPDDKRPIFPFRGASDRWAYVETPGDMAPINTLVNVRPRESVGSRERGGSRPGLTQPTDTNGTEWGQLNSGPVQWIGPLSRPAQQTGVSLGACEITHPAFESHDDGNLIGNLYVLRGRSTRPSLSRHIMVGGVGFETGTDRDLTAVVWTGPAAIAGGVNENPPATDLDNIVFKASFLAGQNNDGWGTPGWSEFDNFDPGGSAISTNGGPWPIEQCTVLYGDSTLGTTLFAGLSINTAILAEPLNKGYVVAYNLSSTALATVGVGKRNYERPFGKVYNEAVVGTPSSLAAVSVSTNPGAIEVTGVTVADIGNVKGLYFCYDANPNSEAMVGRYNVTNFVSTGFDLNLTNGGAFQVNGAAFAVLSADFTPCADPLSPHLLSANYPRGARPTGVAVDPEGYIYFVRSSTGWGPLYNAGANPSHHPYYPGYTPITVCKVNPTGSQFEWEAVTRADLSQAGPGITQISDPELVWVKADGDGCYCGGREIRGANVFALDSVDASERWTYRTCAVGQGARVHAACLDPFDGHLWITGERRNDYLGVVSSAYANLWKLDKDSGALLGAFDIGPGVDGLSIDINPDTGLIVVGTLATDS